VEKKKRNSIGRTRTRGWVGYTRTPYLSLSPIGCLFILSLSLSLCASAGKSCAYFKRGRVSHVTPAGRVRVGHPKFSASFLSRFWKNVAQKERDADACSSAINARRCCRSSSSSSSSPRVLLVVVQKSEWQQSSVWKQHAKEKKKKTNDIDDAFFFFFRRRECRYEQQQRQQRQRGEEAFAARENKVEVKDARLE